MGNTAIEQKVKELQSNGGHLETDGYPAGFQAAELPNLAGDDKASILGNNQAFFFVKNNNDKGEANPDKVELDTSKLKELLTNVIENDTKFTMKIDADVVLDQEKFAAKYQDLRPEENQSDREVILRKEAQLISDFLKDKGVGKLIAEILSPGAGDDADLGSKINQALTENFKVEGVKTEEPLKAAVWDVEGKLGAKQNYAENTQNTERKWQLGTQPEMAKNWDKGDEGSASILDAVYEARNMDTVKLTSTRAIDEAIRQNGEQDQQQQR
jgi:hypothetical protein